jgi:curved DNA-binding protein CbpA
VTGRPGSDGGRRPGDPFTILGLARRADLGDDEVRAAWRRVATATHPDREDGGDPQLFAVAAAAYTTLRTRFGRGEVLADLTAGSGAGTGPDRRPGRRRGRWLGRPRAAFRPASEIKPDSVTPRFPRPRGQRAARLAARIRGGRPGRLALRVLVTAAASVVAVAAAGPHPAAPALVTGAVTWLIGTARRDLAPPG